ncbi:hypothetical protein Anapl_09757 [Anas platyrhynchos]|uniref:Uncharacterized protein n=1 Tax=Anas platyrhynchos TaxID=8839 RepID=R0JX42_ANAPL|nr:hypothetical protein Anapl_09757 [Anas platyrhynchos]
MAAVLFGFEDLLYSWDSLVWSLTSRALRTCRFGNLRVLQLMLKPWCISRAVYQFGSPNEELRKAARAKSQMQEVIQGQIPPCCELPSGTPTGAQCPSGTWQELDDVCSIAQPASPAACDHLCRVGAFGHRHSGVLAALIKLREGRNVGFTAPANLLCSTSTGPCVLKGFV